MESCAIKTLLAGGGGSCLPSILVLSPWPTLHTGFAIGAFFSLMSTSFAYEDPLLRSQAAAGMNTRQKTVEMFRDMGRGMLRSGKGFGKVGGLFGGIECVIESVRVISAFFFVAISF
jgi:mitochondrial import inner membrane translocase subunit TIM22